MELRPKRRAPTLKLDFDETTKKQTFSVTVKAKGGTQTAQVTVNIVVTDVNEPPEVTDSERR